MHHSVNIALHKRGAQLYAYIPVETLQNVQSVKYKVKTAQSHFRCWIILATPCRIDSMLWRRRRSLRTLTFSIELSVLLDVVDRILSWYSSWSNYRSPRYFHSAACLATVFMCGEFISDWKTVKKILYSDRLRFRSFDLLRSEKYNVTFFCVRQWPRLFLCREAITQTDKARRLSHQSPPNSNNNTMIRSDKTN